MHVAKSMSNILLINGNVYHLFTYKIHNKVPYIDYKMMYKAILILWPLAQFNGMI